MCKPIFRRHLSNHALLLNGDLTNEGIHLSGRHRLAHAHCSPPFIIFAGTLIVTHSCNKSIQTLAPFVHLEDRVTMFFNFLRHNSRLRRRWNTISCWWTLLAVYLPSKTNNYDRKWQWTDATAKAWTILSKWDVKLVFAHRGTKYVLQKHSLFSGRNFEFPCVSHARTNFCKTVITSASIHVVHHNALMT